MQKSLKLHASSTALSNISAILTLNKDLEEAEKQIKLSIEKNTNNINAIINQSVILSLKEEFKEACIKLETVLNS